MIIHVLLGLISTVLGLYELLVLAYVVIQLLKVTPNQWTVLLTRVVEPVLTPIRGFLNARLPDRFRILDWSPVVVWVGIWLVQRLIALLRF